MLDNEPAAAAAPADTPALDTPAPPATDSAAAPVAATDGDVAPGAGGSPAGDTDAPKRTPWFQDRINELTRKNNEERRAREAAEAALLAKLNGDRPQGDAPMADDTPPGGKRVYTEDEVRELVSREAQQVQRTQSFNKACDAAFDKGAAAHPDFKEAVATLSHAGLINPADTSFVEDALETEAPHEVLYYLGKNPEEALEIQKLNPRARVLRLDRLATKLSIPTPKPISSAPAPGTPVGGSAKAELDINDPSLPMAEYVRRRNEEEAANRR